MLIIDIRIDYGRVSCVSGGKYHRYNTVAAINAIKSPKNEPLDKFPKIFMFFENRYVDGIEYIIPSELMKEVLVETYIKPLKAPG